MNRQDRTQTKTDYNEDSLRGMLRDFYSSRPVSITIIIWAWGLLMAALAVYSAVAFFRAEQTRDHILFAALFIVAVQFLSLVKIFAWQMIHRNALKRRLQRIELALAELTER